MKRIPIFITLSLLLAGCTTDGAGVNAPVKTVSAPTTAGSRDTLVSRAGISLSAEDVGKAIRAEQFALASAPAGEAVDWRGRDASGSVVAASPFQVGDQNCRQLTQSITFDGREFVGRGAACRNADGSWSLLN